MLCYLAQALDARGYLQDSAQDVAQTLGVSIAAAHWGISTLRRLDPPGVGARDLSDCLLLQLQRLEQRDPLAEQLVLHLNELAYDSAALANMLCVSAQRFLQAKRMILSLNPIPGNGFAPKEDIGYTCAELIVETDADGSPTVSLNDALELRLEINHGYAASIRTQDGSEGTEDYLRQCRQSASALIQSISRRRQTLLACGKAIVASQWDFFLNGPGALHPFCLRDLSEMVGIHISTASRAVQSKSLLCKYGVVPLNSFLQRNAAQGWDGCNGFGAKAEDPFNPFRGGCIKAHERSAGCSDAAGSGICSFQTGGSEL